jgi:hypothetical protein
MSQAKTYTTSEITSLIANYMPESVMCKENGWVYRLQETLIIDTGQIKVYGKEGGNHWLDIDQCRLILRSPDSLTDAELQELLALVDRVCDPGITPTHYIENDGTSDRLYIKYGKVAEVGLGIGEWTALKVAQFLFRKQINFLTLPTDIAVTGNE